MTGYSFGTQTCADLTEGGRREWLVPDGAGGYAMGTVCGLRTRRYHGLLVVAGATPARRSLALAALDPILTLPGGARVHLGTHEWASGAISPRGHELLSSFEFINGVPRWRWRVGEVALERTLAMRHGQSCLAVVHRLLAGGPVTLSVEPQCTWRDAHGERYAGDLPVAEVAGGVVVAQSYRLSGPGFTLDPQWYYGVHHREEAARGLQPNEDLLRVGRFTLALVDGQELAVTAWAGPDLATVPPPPADTIFSADQRARRIIAGASDSGSAALRLASDAFVVNSRDGGPDVVAGYPWFGTWSRDTMISYEGLFLATDRADEGRSLLAAHAATLSEGMLANTADTGQVEHNTADATLWLPHALARHVEVTGDTDLAAALLASLYEIIDCHLAGTRYGIRIDPDDGLLDQGAPGYALTWMDAIVDGEPVTPRRGKAVELNALWLNALGAVSFLREQARDRRGGADLAALRDRALASFLHEFPVPAAWLRDVLHSPGGVDPPGGEALRPNQLLAFSLPYAPMRTAPTHVNAAMLRAIGGGLLTPLGLRSLAPAEPGYLGAHRGGPADRDRAYHQGTVWPWLIGPYADAARAAGLPTDGLLDGLLAHRGDWGIGSISETADGDPPHRATGCPFQAWSVAETMRVYHQ